MTKSVPIALAVLVVLSLPVLVVGTNGPATTETVDGDHLEVAETPNRLVAGENPRAGYASPSPDIGNALAAEDDSIRSTYGTFAFEQRFDEMNESERHAAIESAVDDIDDRIGELHETERATVADHATGEITDRELLDELARNYETATDLEDRIERLNQLATDVDNATVPSGEFNAELEVYTSPTRERISDGVAGDVSVGDEISLQTTDSGLVTAVIDGDQYVREAIRYDNRDRDEPEQYAELSAVYDAGQDNYPWAFSTSQSASVAPYRSGNIYVVTVQHAQGELRASFDSGTERVYLERQTLDLDAIPTDAEHHLEGDNLAATIETTVADGPVKITAVDPETGEPVESSISIDGVGVGETGSDGKQWIAPPTGEVSVSITTEDGEITESVDLG